MASKTQRQEAAVAAERTGTDPAIVASAASVLLALYEFYVRGDRLSGIFIGLWPPTFLAFASYYKQTSMSDMMKRATGRSGLMGSIERMVQG
jgi:hypothetical protein